MRVLIIGADGTLGGALVAAFRRRGDTVFGTTRHTGQIGTDRPFLDLWRPDDAELPGADIAVLCAAYTGYAACRNEPQTARRLNVDATAALAHRFRETGTRMIYLSTSAVFDGTQPCVAADTAPCPISVYGRSKAAGEASAGLDATIVRLSKVVPQNFPLLVAWHKALSDGATIDAFADMNLAPITLDHAAEALVAVATGSETGVFQVSAMYDISYLDVARHLARLFGASTNLVRSALAADRAIPPEERPRWTGMDTSRLTALTGLTPPDPYAAIEAFARGQIADRQARRVAE